MLDLAGCLGFLLKPFARDLVVGKMRMQDLDGDLIAQQFVASRPDDAHASLSQFFLDEEMPGDFGRELTMRLVERVLGGHEGSLEVGAIIELLF